MKRIPVGSEDTWIDARQLFNDLAIPGFYIRFEDWFTSRIQGQYREVSDWKVEQGDELKFLITSRVADEIAREEIGMPAHRLIRTSHDAAMGGWNQDNNPQKFAITEDE